MTTENVSADVPDIVPEIRRRIQYCIWENWEIVAQNWPRCKVRVDVYGDHVFLISMVSINSHFVPLGDSLNRLSAHSRLCKEIEKSVPLKRFGASCRWFFDVDEPSSHELFLLASEIGADQGPGEDGSQERNGNKS